MVTKGQFLLQIDPEQAEAAVQRAEAALSSASAQAAQARANCLQAQRSYERSAEIKKTNPQLVSDEQIEQLTHAGRSERGAARGGDAPGRAGAAPRCATRAARSARRRSIAPMAGRVTRLNVEEGETAIPGTLNKDAATLLTISDMTRARDQGEGRRDRRRAHQRSATRPSSRSTPSPTRRSSASVVEDLATAPCAAPPRQQTADQAVDYEVTIQLLNAPPETRPDFSATAKIVTDVAQATALSIPIIALTVRENEELASARHRGRRSARAQPTKEVGKRDVEGVFVVGTDNKVTFRPVKVGIAGEKYFEVAQRAQGGREDRRPAPTRRSASSRTARSSARPSADDKKPAATTETKS